MGAAELVIDLTDFLEARLAEDEEWAQAVAHFGTEKWSPSDLGRWEINDDWYPMTEAEAQHIARHDPARVLAECAAKREILSEHRPTTFTDVSLGLENVPVCVKCHNAMDVPDWADEDDWAYPLVQDTWPCRTIRAVLLPFATHPDYDPAWRL